MKKSTSVLLALSVLFLAACSTTRETALRQCLTSLHPERTAEYQRMTRHQLEGEYKAELIRRNLTPPNETHLHQTIRVQP